MYYVYIIQSAKVGSFYTGSTSNLEKRLWYHNKGLNKSTRKYRDWKIVYVEKYLTKSESLIRERFLKKQKNKDFYIQLIKGVNSSGRSSDG